MARQSSSGRDARQNSQRPMPRSAARRKRERRREQQRQQASPSSRRNRRWLAGGGGAAIVVVIILIVLLTRGSGGGGSPSATASPGPTPTPAPLASLATAASGSTVGGLSCASSEPSSNTTTVHLSIYVNGAQRSIPPGVGIAQPQLTQTIAGPDALNGKCYYPLLTHLGAGIVHVEPPAAGTTYTLGQFFALWGQPLTS
ncbi:MAG: hypothetical protein JOY80_06925, partial [Candidatus Dormibacteraeota bacterium]|nr:hypothetical protein [Candidatus Dormibacteraeota bacterium]